MTIRSTIQHKKHLFYSWRFFFLKNIVMCWKNQRKLSYFHKVNKYLTWKHHSSCYFVVFWSIKARLSRVLFAILLRYLGKYFPLTEKALSECTDVGLCWVRPCTAFKISSNLPNLDSLCLNWPFGVEIGLYLRQIASKIGQLNSLTNCLVFLVSLGQISLVNFYLVSKTRNFCSLCHTLFRTNAR